MNSKRSSPGTSHAIGMAGLVGGPASPLSFCQDLLQTTSKAFPRYRLFRMRRDWCFYGKLSPSSGSPAGLTRSWHCPSLAYRCGTRGAPFHADGRGLIPDVADGCRPRGSHGLQIIACILLCSRSTTACVIPKLASAKARSGSLVNATSARAGEDPRRHPWSRRQG